MSQRMRLLITDNGTHPPGKWADFTAEDLFDIDPLSQSENARAARNLKAAVTNFLEDSFAAVMQTEKDALAGDLTARLRAEATPTVDSVDEVVAGIVALAKGTPFEAAYQEPKRVDAIRGILTQHFAIAIDIERSTHVDGRPDDPVAVAYKEARAEHGAHRAHLHMPGEERPHRQHRGRSAT